MANEESSGLQFGAAESMNPSHEPQVMTTSEQIFPTTTPPISIKHDKTNKSVCFLFLSDLCPKTKPLRRLLGTTCGPDLPGVGLLHGFPPRRAVLLGSEDLEDLRHFKERLGHKWHRLAWYHDSTHLVWSGFASVSSISVSRSRPYDLVTTGHT